MHAFRSQQTLAQPAVVEGFGYWSGQDVRLEFRPAEPDSGITFVRCDLPEPVKIPASVEHRVEAPRRTSLLVHGTQVEMIEHVMAALAGLGIDNCEVWCDQPEMPGLDGSSLPCVEALLEAGVVAQDAARAKLIISEVTRVGDDNAWIEARPSKTGQLTVKYRLDYGMESPIGRQTIELAATPETFRNELAGSRTFLLKAEADWLVSQGLGMRASTKDLLIFDDTGPVDNELRYENECVRHKVLDLLGDLALAGCDVVGHIIAQRSGHRLNAELVRVLLKEGSLVEGKRQIA